MVGALKQLGIELEEDWPNSQLTVRGCAGTFPSSGAELFLGNAGTAMRPLTAAVAAAGRGDFVLDGVERMRERPIADLVHGLVQLGVDAECTLGTGCPPVRVGAAGLPSGSISISGAVSSQYLTALLMAAPLSTEEQVRCCLTVCPIPQIRITCSMSPKRSASCGTTAQSWPVEPRETS